MDESIRRGGLHPPGRSTPMSMSRTAVAKVAFVFVLALAVPASVTAQERRQSGPAPYDLSREVTLKGTVIRAYTMPSPPSSEQELSILAVTIDGQPVQLILSARFKTFAGRGFSPACPPALKGRPTF
jgi:hypothetical protein